MITNRITSRYLRGVLPCAALCGPLLIGCVSPSRTDDDYRHKAANTAESMASVVATAQLVVKVAVAKRAVAAYVATA